MYYIGKMEYGPELYHHGIKGMRWGVRRTPEELGHPVSKRKPLLKSNGRVVEDKKKRIKIKDASDERLRSAIARKKLENEYLAEVKRTKELKAVKKEKNNNASKIGEAIVRDVIGGLIKGAAGIGVTLAKGIADMGKEYIHDLFTTDWTGTRNNDGGNNNSNNSSGNNNNNSGNNNNNSGNNNNNGGRNNNNNGGGRRRQTRRQRRGGR